MANCLSRRVRSGRKVPSACCGPSANSWFRARLETEEIPGIVADFRRAAENARKAGFDGVEVHGANGYLIDQFLQDSTNHRTDRYGGSVENRARFLFEIVDAVMDVWGADRVGIHLNTRGLDHDMGDSNPLAIFGHVAKQAASRKIAFVFVREKEGPGSLLADIKRLFGGVVIANDTMSLEDGERLVRDGVADAVSFGKPYLATPDLAERVALGVAFNTPDPSTFYADGPEGYTDYPRFEAARA